MVRSTSALCVAVLALAGCGGGGRPAATPPPPTISFSGVNDGDTVHGTITFTATATGVCKIASFTFTTPAALASVTDTLDATGHVATLNASLDLSAQADGAYRITADATDECNGHVTKDLGVTISQSAPSINVGSPVEGAEVKGTVNIIAQALPTSASTTIQSLVLVDPPAGAGPNTATRAGNLLIAWDTTVPPSGSSLSYEGTVALHFRVTDSAGVTSDFTIHVVVNNRPASSVDVWLSAGGPIANAQIDAWAVSSTNGSIVTSAGNEGVLGTSSITDETGHATLTMTDKNYSGPIQLIARPTTAGTTLRYKDPTDGVSWVNIPSALELTSILSGYQPGKNFTGVVTLWTTLADAEVLAYANGLHRLHPTTFNIAAATAYADPLFTGHFTSSTPRWNLRTTIPSSLTDGTTHSLGDQDYPAFADVALNQLARDLGTASGLGTSLSAPVLVQSYLEGDLAADGQFDGLAPSQLYITGASTRVKLDANTLRVQMAMALDEFLSSPLNTSNISRGAVDSAQIFNTMAGDRSELFGSLAPLPFDNVPPAVTARATFGPSNTPAVQVGAQLWVRGTVTVTVTANDSSGVASTAVYQGPTALNPLPGSSPTIYSVQFDTTRVSDGPLNFTVSSTDTRGNQGTTPFTVYVDNTPPTIAPANPNSNTFYSGTAPFEASATDVGSGVASLVVNGFTVTNNDTSSRAHFFGTWSIPTGTPENTPQTGTYQACDAVGNCSAMPISVWVDQTPPTVTITGGATAGGTTYVKQTPLTVSLHALDGGAGVGSVYLQRNSDVASAARPTGAAGDYNYTVPLSPGTNTVAVWGTDLAQNALGSSPNTGQGRGAPYAATATIVYDPSPPGATFDPQVASYFDEANIAPIANGGYAIPGTYKYASSTKSAVATGGTFNKIVTQTGWAGTETAADLEGPNPFNIPFLHFTVSSISPVTSYSATVQVQGFPIVGPLNLWPSSQTAGAYILPLSSNLISYLAQLTGPTQVTVNATFGNAAGNSATVGPLTFTYSPLGPPVAVALDASYPATASGDPRSVYYYPSSLARYSSLWSVGPFAADGGVRLLHYIVTNPAAVPVAVRPVLGGANVWSLSENWSGANLGAAPTLTYSATCGGGGTFSGTPCPSGKILYVPFWPSGTAGAIQCASSGHTSVPSPQNTTPISGALLLRAYQTNGSYANTTSSGRLIVPAATSSTPGQLDVYVLRPITADRTSLPPLAYNTALSPNAFSTMYERGYTDTPSQLYCGPYESAVGVDTWKGTNWGMTLAGVTESYSATITASTTGYVSSGPGPAEPGVETQYFTAPVSASYQH